MKNRNMDLYLFIPCDLSNFNDSVLNKTTSKEGSLLINQVEMNNKNEFKSEYVKCLKRYEIGKFNFYFKNDSICEKGILSITEHPKTKVGSLVIYIPQLTNEPSLILDIFIANRFKIGNELISTWANKNNIHLTGTSKGLLFSYEPIKNDEIISILACEANTGQVKGKEFIEMAKNDIAQYKTAKVYCSENVLLEIQSEAINDIKSRISMEAVEVFFMELLLLQDAAISRICDKILQELEIENKSPLNATNTDILDALASELSESILFLDFNNFIYPTVRISAEKIARNFRLDKLLDKYNTYKDLLESLINIRKNKIDDLETKNMNILLLILTFTQIIPVLISLFESITEKTLSLEDIISFASSITVCFILLIVFWYINRRKKRKYKEELLNLKI